MLLDSSFGRPPTEKKSKVLVSVSVDNVLNSVSVSVSARCDNRP